MLRLTTDLVLKNRKYANKTYGLSSTRIEGYVNGLDALSQAIYKTLSTERYEYPIYNFDYGVAWKEVIGEEQPYVRAEVVRMVQEALLKDDRIREVGEFQFEFLGDTCYFSFLVTSIFGDIKVKSEVGI